MSQTEWVLVSWLPYKALIFLREGAFLKICLLIYEKYFAMRQSINILSAIHKKQLTLS